MARYRRKRDHEQVELLRKGGKEGEYFFPLFHQPRPPGKLESKQKARRSTSRLRSPNSTSPPPGSAWATASNSRSQYCVCGNSRNSEWACCEAPWAPHGDRAGQGRTQRPVGAVGSSSPNVCRSRPKESVRRAGRASLPHCGRGRENDPDGFVADMLDPSGWKHRDRTPITNVVGDAHNEDTRGRTAAAPAAGTGQSSREARACDTGKRWRSPAPRCGRGHPPRNRHHGRDPRWITAISAFRGAPEHTRRRAAR